MARISIKPFTPFVKKLKELGFTNTWMTHGKETVCQNWNKTYGEVDVQVQLNIDYYDGKDNVMMRTSNFHLENGRKSMNTRPVLFETVEGMIKSIEFEAARPHTRRYGKDYTTNFK